MTNHLLAVVVFAPLAGALINWLAGRRVRSETFVGVVACGYAQGGYGIQIAYQIADKVAKP